MQCVTKNSLHFIFFANLSKYWCNVVIPTLRRHCEFDSAVTRLYQRCLYDIYNMLKCIEATLVQCCEFYVVISMLWRRCELRQWGKVANTACIVRHELNLLSNVEVMLEQRFNFDVVASTSLQHCILVVRCWDLTKTVSLCCVFSGKANRRLFNMLARPKLTISSYLLKLRHTRITLEICFLICSFYRVDIFPERITGILSSNFNSSSTVVQIIALELL